MGLMPFCLGRVEEVHRAVDIAVVGHGDRLLAERGHAIDELVTSQAPSRREYSVCRWRWVNSDMASSILAACDTRCSARIRADGSKV